MDIVKILVVDDEQEVLDVTRGFLRKKNYCTLGATTAKEAIEIVKKESPQVVLLDVRLGNDCGLDTLQQIKDIDRSIKVIVVSALNDEPSIWQAKTLGADDYIAKPFTSTDLENILLKKIADLNLSKKNKVEGGNANG
jgi:two-component system response regulator (stage 0 sporulation protein F)